MDDLTKTMKNFEARVGFVKDLEKLSNVSGLHVVSLMQCYLG